MRLLYITEDVPNRDPAFGDGSSMIPFEILRNLPDDIAVTLVTYRGRVEVPPEVRDRCEAVHLLAMRGRGWALMTSVFGLYGLGRHRRATARAVAASATLSARHDATLIHGPHVQFLARHVQGPLVLQTVDPWSIRIGMEGAMAAPLAHTAFTLRERRALRAERRLPSRARLLTVGAEDARAWSERLGRPVRSIPNGAESVPRPAVRPGPPVICFVGSLNYGPNIDSVKVLIGTVAPLVWDRLPDARFVIAGRQPDPAVLGLAGPRVEVLGNVSSVVEVFHRSDVAVFPDEHGVGIRNSVREALAAGTPVVATPVAAREQEPHPMLYVEPDTPGLVARVADLLVASRSASVPALAREGAEADAGAGPVRTWSDAAHEYLAEIREAISGSGPRLASPAPRTGL